MGAMLPKPILSKVADRAGDYRIGAACVSLNGYRTSMEDAHVMLVEADTSLFGVFDGHNGGGCSQYIADRLPSKLKALNGNHTPGELEKVCVALDRDFMQDVGDASGSTGTFCLITRDYAATICNVGDSRTLVTRAGKLLFVTEDHKPMNPTERDRIEACGGCVVSNRVDGDLAVSRSFGDSSFKRKDAHDDYKNQKVIAVPDVTKFQCQKGDVIILACDGVFEGSFSNEEVTKFVHEQLPRSTDLAVVAARVCDEAIRRGSKDNISCLIVRLCDGSSEVRAYGAHSFLPGPPFPRTHEASRTAYAFMAQLANLSTAEALAARYALLKEYEKKTLSTKAPLEQIAFEMSDETDIETEKNFFGRGPAPGNEAAFFRYRENEAEERSRAGESIRMLRCVADDDAFAENLPASVAVQYRVLQKMLPFRKKESQHAGVGVAPLKRIGGGPPHGDEQWKPGRGFVPPSSAVSPAMDQFAAGCQKLPCVEVVSCGGNGDDLVCEIELGGPILDQLRKSRVSHARVCSLLGELQHGLCRTLTESEAGQRRLIEGMANSVFDVLSSPFVGELLKQVGLHVQRTWAAENREMQLQQDLEEMRRRNEYLESLLMSVEVGRVPHREQPEQLKQEETLTLEELRTARKTIASLQQKLKNEDKSKEQLRSLAAELDALKEQYTELVSSHTNGRPIILASATEDEMGVSRAEALTAEVEDLRSQLSQRNASIQLLRHELVGLQHVAGEIGSLRAKVSMLERRLNSITNHSSFDG